LGEKPGTKIRVNLATSIDLRIRKDGYAWVAWRMVVCLCRMRLLGDDGPIDGVEAALH
jgi:hypothetical protein